MTAFLALIRRDLLLAARSGGSLTTLLAFYLSLGVILPIAIGPDKDLLAQLGPALIWTGVLLSSLIGLDRLFVTDHDEGVLAALRHAALPLTAVALAKLIVHWLSTALPLIVFTPLLAVLFFMDVQSLWTTGLALLLGTPTLAALSLLAAALSVSLKRGAAVVPVLVLPFAVPVVIFGVAAANPLSPGEGFAAVQLLGALSLLAVALAPFGAALALRLGAE